MGPVPGSMGGGGPFAAVAQAIGGANVKPELLTKTMAMAFPEAQPPQEKVVRKATPAAAQKMSSPMAPYRDAIAAIESAGSGDYAAIGPKHSKLGRALGRYQIMEANVGPWSQQVLGRPVSVEEFMSNPQIQDQIFDGKFGSYIQKYGSPEEAASVWFTGQPSNIGGKRKDVLGTSGNAYVAKFRRALARNGGRPQDAMMTIAQGEPLARVNRVVSEMQQNVPPSQSQFKTGIAGLDRVLATIQQPTGEEGTEQESAALSMESAQAELPELGPPPEDEAPGFIEPQLQSLAQQRQPSQRQQERKAAAREKAFNVRGQRTQQKQRRA